MLLPVPPDSTLAYIIMQFCHVCGMQSFVSGLLFQFASLRSLQQAYKPAQPELQRPGSAQVPAAALPAPATATSSAAVAGPCSPRPPAAATGASRGQRSLSPTVTVVYVFFAAAVPGGGARRGQVQRARCRRYCGPLRRRTVPTGGARRRAAAATSASALQASKFYSGKTAESISNNAQCSDMENESVPLQRENR